MGEAVLLVFYRRKGYDWEKNQRKDQFKYGHWSNVIPKSSNKNSIKVFNENVSKLRNCRLLMKAILDAHLQWPFDKEKRFPN